MKKTGLFLAFVLCMLCTALLTPAVVSADKIQETNFVISEGDYKSILLLGLVQDEDIDVSVTVTSPSGGLVDVYIIPSSDIYSYPSSSFTPELSREGVSSTDFTFTNPDGLSYYLVIDNVNNSRTTDTVPVGSVTVDYEYDDPWEELEKAVEALAWTCVAIIVIGVIVVIVIIVVIVWVVTKKEKPPQYPPQYQQPPQTQQPGYQQYPQQPQQPYQPPPQQPPGQ